METNDKLEVSLPVDAETMLCITNDSNETCELIKGSNYFEKCYEISLNKKGVGFIQERNSNSDYLKIRFNYYDKKRNRN